MMLGRGSGIERCAAPFRLFLPTSNHQPCQPATGLQAHAPCISCPLHHLGNTAANVAGLHDTATARCLQLSQ